MSGGGAQPVSRGFRARGPNTAGGTRPPRRIDVVWRRPWHAGRMKRVLGWLLVAGVVVEVMENEDLMENAATVGSYLMEQLNNFDGVREVRGQGLMIGVEFDFPTGDLRKYLLFEEKVFVGSASNTHVIRLLPPLSLSKAEADLFLGKLERSLAKMKVVV